MSDTVYHYGQSNLEEPLPQLSLPPVYLAHFNAVFIHAPSFAVIAGKTIWCQGEEVQLDIQLKEVQGGSYYSSFVEGPDGKYEFRTVVEILKDEKREVILIGNRVRCSYFHWLFDCLPRLLLADQYGIPPHYSLLVLAPLQGSFLQSLDLINVNCRAVIEQPMNTLLPVKEVVVPSVRTFLPDTPKQDIRRAVVDPDAVCQLRQTVIRRSSISGAMHGERKPKLIFVSRARFARRTGGRDIINSEQLERMILDRSGAVVFPEEMAFRVQVETFSSAQVIVGMAGSALANLVFAQPGARAIIISASAGVNPRLFVQIGQAVGVDVRLVLGTAIPEDGIPRTHWSIHVSPGLLMKALDEALSGYEPTKPTVQVYT